jgi:hypothetical protein
MSLVAWLLEPSYFCARAMETKMTSKIGVHAMKTLTIGSTIKIGSTYMHLHMCTWSCGSTGFLCYLYELFTLIGYRNLVYLNHVPKHA